MRESLLESKFVSLIISDEKFDNLIAMKPKDFISSSLLQHHAHPLALLLLRQPLHGRSEEENAQYGKHDEEFHRDNDPQRAPPSHMLKAITTEPPRATDYVQVFVHAANIKHLL